MGLIEDAMSRRNRQSGPARARPRSYPVGQQAAPPALHNVRQVEPNEVVAVENRLICDELDSAAVSAYKMLRTQVVQRLKAKGWSSLGVTASRAGEGKTLTAINLALSLVKNPDQNVFLVDFDLRRHSIAGYLGIDGDAALLEVLNGAPLEDGLIQYGNQGLYLLLNDVSVENSSERLASDEAAALVHKLRDLGGIVIYDLPPLLSSDDFLAFSSQLDCTLFVVSEGETERNDLLRAREMLENTNSLGVVLNKSKEQGLVDSYYY